MRYRVAVDVVICCLLMLLGAWSCGSKTITSGGHELSPDEDVWAYPPPERSGGNAGRFLIEDAGAVDAGEDNGFNYSCEYGTVRICLTECGMPGTQKCMKQWGPCVAGAELCNGIDDDCNGMVDDDAPCDGTKQCVEGTCQEPALPEVWITQDLMDTHWAMAGDNHNFNVTALVTGSNDTTLSYQWYLSTDGGASYEPIPGAIEGTLARYNPFYYSDNGALIKCRAIGTNSVGTDYVESKASVLTVARNKSCSGPTETACHSGFGGIKPSATDQDDDWIWWSFPSSDICEVSANVQFTAGGRPEFCAGQGGVDMAMSSRLYGSDGQIVHSTQQSGSANGPGLLIGFNMTVSGAWDPDVDGAPKLRVLLLDDGTTCKNGTEDNIFGIMSVGTWCGTYKKMVYLYDQRP